MKRRMHRGSRTYQLETIEPRQLLTTYLVSTAADSGAGSLRQAILDSVGNPGSDEIHFNIGGGGPATISPLSALPTVSDGTTIDATTQPGFSGSPLIQLSGILVPGGVAGLRLDSDNVVRGMGINRFTQTGITINGNNNVVAGNWIGTDATGTAAAANVGGGVRVNGNSNTIGGTAAADRNVISGNLGGGLSLVGGNAYYNEVLGNFIGTNAAGSAAVGNSGAAGVDLNNAPYNVIGQAGAGNVIAGNAGEGIIVRTNTYGTTIRGNYVGTDATGTIALGNNIGIFMTSTYSITVGGSNPGEGNLVSGNRNNGISGLNSSYCTIQGNSCGTKAGGTGSLGNAFFGINVNSSSSFFVGGSTAGERNIVCYNGAGGINLTTNAFYNQVSGNWIGVDANGDAAGNSSRGIQINNSSYNTIGGYSDEVGNRIAFNSVGIGVLAGVGNNILRNSIYSNGNLGIDLGIVGVTANDLGDGDTGANDLQNYPVLTHASSRPNGSTATGTLNSTPYNYFEIQFFASVAADATTFGEGQTYIGSTYVSTDEFGNATFAASLAPAAVGQVITATATSYYYSSGTSEFSKAVTVEVNRPFAASDDAYTLDQGTTLYTYDPLGQYNDASDDGVCANDDDPDGDWLTAELVSGPAHGQLYLYTDGTFSYTPDISYYGTDSFTYKASDGEFDSVATVTFTINKNKVPVAGDESYTVNEETQLYTWDYGGFWDSDPNNDGVLANDSDANGQSLHAVLVDGPAHGTLALNWDGTFQYTPEEDFQGVDTFTYRASDDIDESNLATVTLNVVGNASEVVVIPDPCYYWQNALLVTATDGDDVIEITPVGKGGGYAITMNGTSLGTFNEPRLIIRGEAGDDDIHVAGGVSVPVMLFGESGNDKLNAGHGSAILIGGGGDDDLNGSNANDLLIGGKGSDHLNGGPGQDILIAGTYLYENDYYALCSLMDIWNQSGMSFYDRHTLLSYPWYYYFGLHSGTVFDDPTDASDHLTGASGDDWYCYRDGEDKASGLAKNESAYVLLV